MNDLEDIKFKVDEHYQNEKGIFKVISIHRGHMVIRWENGEEIRTKVKLQRRIAKRRQWEKENQSAKSQTVSKSSPKSGSTRKKPVFPGFVPTDFKRSVSRTTWRSRNQLGVEVTQKIDTARFEFNSWAFGYKPEMHVQDINHRSRAANDYQAKFFIRVDPIALYFGFRVARPDNLSDVSTDWEAFMGWLIQKENEQLVNELAAKDNLTCRLINPSSGKQQACEYAWSTGENGERQDKNSLAAFINAIPQSEPVDLELSATVDKSDAVACGNDISAKIGKLFTRLVPIYQAAVTH